MAWPFIRGVGIVLVEEHISTSIWLHLLLNHLVHNRNIKMSEWPHYFCSINNTHTVAAKLLQRSKAACGGISLRWQIAGYDFALLTC